MLPRVSHGDAISLERIVRQVYNCDRFGVGGLANADTLERSPMLAAYAALAPLYLKNKKIADVDAFLDRYACIYEFENDEPPTDEDTERFIDELDNLVGKYYGKNR